MSITRAVYKFLDTIDKECNISGWQLYDAINRETGRCIYPTSLLQMARDYADITGADFECIDHQRSIYKFVPNIKLGNAILVGIE